MLCVCVAPSPRSGATLHRIPPLSRRPQLGSAQTICIYDLHEFASSIHCTVYLLFQSRALKFIGASLLCIKGADRFCFISNIMMELIIQPKVLGVAYQI